MGRVIVRAVAAGDAEFYARLVQDAQVRQYLGGSVAQDQVAAGFDAMLAAPQGVMYRVAALRMTGHPLGLVSITPHKEGGGSELSFQFVPQVWGQGVAFEACCAVLALWRGEVLAETQAANARSRRLLRRLGFVEEGRVMRFGAEQVMMRRGHS